MKKLSLFCGDFTNDVEKGVTCLNMGMDFDYGYIIKNKDEAIKAVAFLMTEWKITMQDFVNEYNKKKGGD